MGSPANVQTGRAEYPWAWSPVLHFRSSSSARSLRWAQRSRSATARTLPARCSHVARRRTETKLRGALEPHETPCRGGGHARPAVGSDTCGRGMVPAVGCCRPVFCRLSHHRAAARRGHPHFRTASRCPGEGRARRSAVRIASPASPAQDPSDPRLYIIRHHFALRTQRKATELLQVWCVRCF